VCAGMTAVAGWLFASSTTRPWVSYTVAVCGLSVAL
jgi:hypothetical protein